MDSSGSTSSDLQVVQVFLAAVARDDLEGAIELLDPEVDWRPQLGAALGGATTYRGHDGFRHYYAAVREVLDDFSVEVLSHRHATLWLVTDIRMTGRGKASGIKVDQRFVQVWRVQAGKVLAAQTFRDAKAAAAAIERT
jgi:ketosteroid isomerase-like protein